MESSDRRHGARANEQGDEGEKRSGGGVYAQLALGMAAFGSATPISKLVTGAMPVFVASTFRVALGALTLAPLALKKPGLRSQLSDLDGRDWLKIALIALFGMFGFTALMLYGMRMVSGVVGAIVMSTAPAVTATASMIFLKDEPTWRKLTAIALAVSGVLLLHLGGGSDSGSGAAGGSGAGATSGEKAGGDLVLGSVLVFAAVCCETVYSLVGKKVSERVDPILAAFLAAALSLPFFLPFAVWQWSDFAPGEVGLEAWIALLWYGVGTLALGTWLWYSGLSKAEGSVAAGFMGVMPASALVLSYVLLGEPFRLLHLAGFTVVLGGVLLISWEHARMASGKS